MFPWSALSKVVEIDCGDMKDYQRRHFPKSAKVGDILIIEGDKITISKEGTKKLKEEFET
ncbi:MULTISPECIES: DUF3006 domain-containing protein [unclassified Bacillus (in: firmicutes)]|uniref:DUF3006 domain-containing protein n=1 Tax=unclassified Bacillus (in: firmicutes) TaxID=185979 RepID=UPI0037C1119B